MRKVKKGEHLIKHAFIYLSHGVVEIVDEFLVAQDGKGKSFRLDSNNKKCMDAVIYNFYIYLFSHSAVCISVLISRKNYDIEMRKKINFKKVITENF